LQIFPFLDATFTTNFIKYGAKCVIEKTYYKTISVQSIIFADYLRLNVIYDSTVDLQVRISITELTKTVPELDYRCRGMTCF